MATIPLTLTVKSRDVTSHHFNTGLEYYLEKFYLNAELGFGQLEVEDRLAMPIGTLSNTAKEDIYTYRAVADYMPMSNLLLVSRNLWLPKRP